MNEKETDKGPADLAPVFESLQKLDAYMGKLKEFGIFQNPHEVSRIMVHIANYAMLAEKKICETKETVPVLR